MTVQFFAVAQLSCDDGKIFLHWDSGTSWTPQTPGVTNYLSEVVYTDGKFIAEGYEGTPLEGRPWPK
ncbi:MAG: hypothetical protein LBB63_02430 [Holosporaceae bacterium]|nr:hypothetical protein [Holosporaceae bacterium]